MSIGLPDLPRNSAMRAIGYAVALGASIAIGISLGGKMVADMGAIALTVGGCFGAGCLLAFIFDWIPGKKAEDAMQDGWNKAIQAVRDKGYVVSESGFQLLSVVEHAKVAVASSEPPTT